MQTDYDAIVIGSGFGGAITGCRLAENGYRVLMLERGRRWHVSEYPRSEGDAWIWDQYHPEKRNGWLDVRFFPNMVVWQGAGVGGGSLVYANISVEPHCDLFDCGWPKEITYDELRPYYDKVGAMLDVQKVPERQWPARTRLVKAAAERAGYGDRFRTLDLAVSFDPEWSYELEDPHNVRHSRGFINAQGQEQGTCIHLGNCDLGCEVKARNTLDLNYIPRAEKHGAEVLPLHLVRAIEPENGMYRVWYDRIDNGQLVPGSVTGRIVVLAAGSLGSTELLLRCRDEFGTLPNLSRRLGLNWSSNGDFVTPALHRDWDVSPTEGPTITSAIDFLDGSVDDERFFIEDGGFPDIFRNWAAKKSRVLTLRPLKVGFALTARRALGWFLGNPIDHLMPWFAQGIDAADGSLFLRRRWRLFGARRLHLKWQITESKDTIDAIVLMHKKLAAATGGRPIVPFTWTLLRDLTTPHPLGGCNMGTNADDGVVDHQGKVFGYRNLYVADGAIVPEAIGANPSKTIGALAERIARLMISEGC